MGRPREFHEADVLDAAVRAFWIRGFEATSMRDLARETGLACASLYNAFGDKRALYRRALDHYVGTGLDQRLARLAGELQPRQAIAAFFDDVIERSLADRERRGCMLVNSALELAPHDAEMRRLVALSLTRLETFFRDTVAAGQRDGTIAPERSADDLARTFLALLSGIRVLARSRPERDLLEGLLRPPMSLLDP